MRVTLVIKKPAIRAQKQTRILDIVRHLVVILSIKLNYFFFFFLERPASAMAMSPRTERTLQEIDRDINQIWRELQELEKLPNGTYRPRGGSNGSVSGAGVASKPNLPPSGHAPSGHAPSGHAPSASPVTPVRIKASYVASAATPTKYSTNDPPPVAVSTPSSQRRTIWDMDSEMPSTGGAATVATPSTGGVATVATPPVAGGSKSNPVTPQVPKKIELPPRAAPSPVPPTAPASHSGVFSHDFSAILRISPRVKEWS